MPNRMLNGEITSSESLSRVSLEAVSTFLFLTTKVDDFGRLDGRLRFLMSTLYPIREDVTEQALARWLGELEREQLIHRYEKDGRHFVHLPSWAKYQRLRSQHSKWPEPTCCEATTEPPPTAADRRRPPQSASGVGVGDGSGDGGGKKKRRAPRARPTQRPEPQEWVEEAERMAKAVAAVHPTTEIPKDLAPWARELRLLHRPKAEVRETCEWVLSPVGIEAGFKVLSAASLRKDRGDGRKYDRIRAAMNRPRLRPVEAPRGRPAVPDWTEEIEEARR